MKVASVQGGSGKPAAKSGVELAGRLPACCSEQSCGGDALQACGDKRRCGKRAAASGCSVVRRRQSCGGELSCHRAAASGVAAANGNGKLHIFSEIFEIFEFF